MNLGEVGALADQSTGVLLARARQRPQRDLLLVRVLLAHPLVVGRKLGQVLVGVVRQQALGDADAARRVRNIDHRPLVMRRNLDRGVHPRGGRTADQQRNLAHAKVFVLLHLAGHILHFLQARRDQSRQADDVGALDLGARQYLVARNHHAHVDDVEVVALQNHGNDVFADVVHVALDRRDDDLALGAHVFASALLAPLFFLDVRDEVRHRLLHHARAFDDLRQEHLALAEQVADDVHSVHQRPFDHVQRPPAFGQHILPGLFGVGDDEIGDAVHQRVR